jgi:hypothetical protein
MSGELAARCRRTTITLVSAVAVLVTCLTVGAPAAHGAAPTQSCLPNCVIQDEANWILQHQTSDGMIAMGVPDGHIFMLVQPYDAGYAAIGLADASGATGNPVNAVGAWKWLRWYAGQMAANAPSPAHLNTCLIKNVVPLESPTSTISCWYVYDQCLGASAQNLRSPFPSDHTRSCARSRAASVPTPILQTYPHSSVTHPYVDATDAGAAMFLVALDRAYATTHNLATLAAVDGPGGAAGGAIGEAVAAIHSTLDPIDGVTFASPWWPPTWPYPHKYLEDVAETAAGLRAAARLEAALTLAHHGSSAVGIAAAAMATTMAKSVNAAWWRGGARAAYAWAKDQHGVLAPTNWSASAFADPQENLWAVLWDLAPSDRAAAVTNTFSAAFGPRVNHRLWMPTLARGAILPQPLYWAALAEAKIVQLALARSAVILLDREYASRAWQFQPRDAGLAIWVTTLVDGT